MSNGLTTDLLSCQSDPIWYRLECGVIANREQQHWKTYRYASLLIAGCVNLPVHLQGLTLKDVQTALGEDCPIAPVFEYLSVPEEVTGVVDTVSASVADVNKVILDLRCLLLLCYIRLKFDQCAPAELLFLLQLWSCICSQWHQRPAWHCWQICQSGAERDNMNIRVLHKRHFEKR